MKILLRIVLSVIGLVIFIGLAAFALGATMPEDHTVSITGTVNAPPAKVFAIITDVANVPSWRSNVKSVEVLPKDNFRDSWIETYNQGPAMKFVALTTAAPGPNGKGDRNVETKNNPTFGGAWDYQISPGPTAGTTTLQITETGYIKTPIYRFMMKYIYGPTKNLDQYMADLQARVAK
jgi:uncharacterized protein YndB with AHSA1/START domain